MPKVITGSDRRSMTPFALGVTGDADLLTVEEAAGRLRIGRTKMYGLIAAGEVESVTIGTLRRIPSECLTAYVSDLLQRARSAA